MGVRAIRVRVGERVSASVSAAKENRRAHRMGRAGGLNYYTPELPSMKSSSKKMLLLRNMPITMHLGKRAPGMHDSCKMPFCRFVQEFCAGKCAGTVTVAHMYRQPRGADAPAGAFCLGRAWRSTSLAAILEFLWDRG